MQHLSRSRSRASFRSRARPAAALPRAVAFARMSKMRARRMSRYSVPSRYKYGAAPEWTDEQAGLGQSAGRQSSRRWWPIRAGPGYRAPKPVEGEPRRVAVPTPSKPSKGTPDLAAAVDLGRRRSPVRAFRGSAARRNSRAVAAELRRHRHPQPPRRAAALPGPTYTLQRMFELWDRVQRCWPSGVESDLVVVANLDYGHSSPMGVLPLGVRARVDPIERTIRTLEPAVTTASADDLDC